MNLETRLAQVLAKRKSDQLFRQRKLIESPQGPKIIADGRKLIGFCSNDYLGLANHPKVIDSFQYAASKYGVGSGASHLVCGHGEYHQELELSLAEFTGRERAVLFSTGYMANLGTINALVGRGDSVLEDKLNHASLLDGGLSCGAKFKRFLHNNPGDLERLLNRDESENRLVVVDGVFSMDGDIAPLPELAALCERHDAWLMVDDAHGFGVLGDTGGGCAQHFSLSQNQLPVLVGTLGKAFGTFGAFVAGSDNLIETLIQLSRTYIYTTALPAAVAAATRTSVDLVSKEHWRREKLQSLITQFRSGAQQLGLPLMDSTTPIQPIIIGSESRTMAIANFLHERGYWVGAIRPPTVAKGSARLRITLSALHSSKQVEGLLSNLEDAMRVVP